MSLKDRKVVIFYNRHDEPLERVFGTIKDHEEKLRKLIRDIPGVYAIQYDPALIAHVKLPPITVAPINTPSESW